MRDYQALVQTGATRVDYLSGSRMGFLKVKCEIPEEVFNSFSCWEVRPEFLD